MTYDAVDLFAGPGGWDLAARHLGMDVLGIEWDHAAYETRRAAGLPTVEGDVRSYGPADFPARGLIGSPPCQTFSPAGNGAGRRALDVVLELVDDLAKYGTIDWSRFDDERTGLVLEPLRWALAAIDAGTPYEWIALEQVPAVLPVWQAMAEVLRTEGYDVAVGKLSAEQYGVPQTRKRAILVACRQGQAVLPAPTHRAYRKGVPQSEGDLALRPWVSMAQALGWAATARPSMRFNYGTGGDPAARGERMPDEPAPTITSKADRNKRTYMSSTMPGATVRSEAEPAPTVAFGNDAASVRWLRNGTQKNACVRNVDEPAGEVDSIRVTVTEAATLQTFPVDHPWRGGKTKQFQQIGNAIPPLLAAHILAAVAQPRWPG